MENSEYVMEMNGISKRFGGVYALKDVSIKIKRGTCHALLGENGAGKSTLMKILSGIVEKDTGEIILEGNKVEIKNLDHAEQLGIALVPQELSFVSYFTVAENIFLGDEPQRALNCFIDWKKLYKNADKLLKDLNIDLSSKKTAKDLNVSNQQMMIIARALSRNAQIVIMDEPTARLSHGEIIHLLEYINHLKKEGKTIIYISHRLEEIFQICDNVSVLRDGRLIDTVPAASIDKKQLIKMMVNRDIKEGSEKKSNREIGKVILSVKHLNKANVLKDVYFDVREGEILGLFGLVGAGRTESIRAVLGIDKYDGAEITYDGKPVKFKSYQEALERGIAFVPEERRKQGVLPHQSIAKNITIGNLKYFSKLGLLNKSNEKVCVNKVAKSLNIICRSIEQPVGDLSGGNQQKVVLAKYIHRDIRLFILDEPTRGIDIGAKEQIYKIIEDLAKSGAAVIVISSEIPELQLLCDRVSVMTEGKITGELSREDIIVSDNVLKYAIGV